MMVLNVNDKDEANNILDEDPLIKENMVNIELEELCCAFN